MKRCNEARSEKLVKGTMETTQGSVKLVPEGGMELLVVVCKCTLIVENFIDLCFRVHVDS